MLRLPAMAIVAALASACSVSHPMPHAGLGPSGAPLLVVAEEPAQASGSWVGTELRVYPAGVIPTLYGELPLDDHAVLTADLGANVTERDDFGEHDDEHGHGYGGGVGYRHYLGEQLDDWFLGARVDLWSLSIDWKDHPGTPNSRRGTSDVIVLQPTAELGYGFRLDERSRLNVFVAAGAEINVATSGESVGQGAIGLVGVSYVYRF